MDEVGTGKFMVSFRMLVDALRLPEGTKIRAIYCDPDDNWDEGFWVYVRGPGLPVVEENERSPDVHPVWHQEEDGTVRLASW